MNICKSAELTSCHLVAVQLIIYSIYHIWIVLCFRTLYVPHIFQIVFHVIYFWWLIFEKFFAADFSILITFLHDGYLSINCWKVFHIRFWIITDSKSCVCIIISIPVILIMGLAPLFIFTQKIGRTRCGTYWE